MLSTASAQATTLTRVIVLTPSRQRQHHGTSHCVIGVAGAIQGSACRFREPSWQPLIVLPASDQFYDALGMASTVAPRCAYSTAPDGRLYNKAFKFIATNTWIEGCSAKCKPGQAHLAMVVAQCGGDGRVSITGIQHKLRESRSYPLPLGRNIVRGTSLGQPLLWSGTSTKPGRVGAHQAVGARLADWEGASRRTQPCEPNGVVPMPTNRHWQWHSQQRCRSSRTSQQSGLWRYCAILADTTHSRVGGGEAPCLVDERVGLGQQRVPDGGICNCLGEVRNLHMWSV